MEKIAMRILLLVLMGTFLLLSGIFMDVMGSQIKNTSSENSSRLPFSPLVLVGRCIIAVGVSMLVAAIFFKVRERYSAKGRLPFQRESISPDIIREPQCLTSLHPEPQEATLQNIANQSPSRTSMVSYTDSFAAHHRVNPYDAQPFGRHLMNYPSPPPFSRPHSSTLTDHNFRYSETYDDRGQLMYPPTSDSPSAALIPSYRVSPKARSPYEDELASNYDRGSPEHAFRPVEYNHWERNVVNHPRSRSSVLTGDMPPPYESTDMPPPYISLTSALRANNK